MSEDTLETLTDLARQEIEQEVKSFGDRFQEAIIDHFPALFEFGVRFLTALLIFIIGRSVIGWTRRRVRNSFEKKNADIGVMKFTDSLMKVLMYLVLLLMIAANMGIELSSITVFFASAGVGITLALQESLSNLAGGVFILLLKLFKCGRLYY